MAYALNTTTRENVDHYKADAIIGRMLEDVPADFPIELAIADPDFHALVMMTFLLSGGEPTDGSSPYDAVQALYELKQERDG